MIIDAHTHTFPEKIAAKAVAKLEAMAKSRAYTEATDAALTASMKRADIDACVQLPVATSAAQVEKLNDKAAAKNEHFAETGIFSLGAMHPDYENYRAELRRIQANGITGIKLHPAYQDRDLDDPRFLRIIDEASALGLAVVVHAGWDIGFMHHNFASVDMICRVLREVAPDRLLLAHLGSWKDWDAVECTLAGEAVYMDTAFIFGSYEPPAGMFVPDEERKMIGNAQFQRILAKHGYEKILFGSDSPWSDQSVSLAQLLACAPDKNKTHLLLGENAQKLFKIPLRA